MKLKHKIGAALASAALVITGGVVGATSASAHPLTSVNNIGSGTIYVLRDSGIAHILYNSGYYVYGVQAVWQARGQCLWINGSTSCNWKSYGQWKYLGIGQYKIRNA